MRYPVAMTAVHNGLGRPSEIVPLKSLYRAYRGVCWICRSFVPFDEASRDHIHPRSLGGSDHRDNLALAHKKCNTRRGNGYKDIHFVHFNSVDGIREIKVLDTHGLIVRFWQDKKNGGYNLLVQKRTKNV